MMNRRSTTMVVTAALLLVMMEARVLTAGQAITRSSTLPKIKDTPGEETSDRQLQAMLQKIELTQAQLATSLSRLETNVAAIGVEMVEVRKQLAGVRQVSNTILGQMLPPSCADMADNTVKGQNGVFAIMPDSEHVVKVRCEFGPLAGWTVILARNNGEVPFNRTFEEYRRGFGDLKGEFWIGNDLLHKLTTRKSHQLMVTMEDFNGRTATARYNSFSVAGPEEQYRLSVSGFVDDDGGAGNAMTLHNNMQFTTIDKDGDNSKDGNCALLFGGGGGWWYNNCYHALPTGSYRTKPGNAYGGVAWYPFVEVKHSLKAIKLMISPSTQ